MNDVIRPSNEHTKRVVAAARKAIEGKRIAVGSPLHLLEMFIKIVEEHAPETSEPRAPSGHVGGCMCSPCREWRLVQHANTLKANSCVCGEPNSPGTHRTDGPCLAPIGDHHP